MDHNQHSDQKEGGLRLQCWDRVHPSPRFACQIGCVSASLPLSPSPPRSRHHMRKSGGYQSAFFTTAFQAPRYILCDPAALRLVLAPSPMPLLRLARDPASASARDLRHPHTPRPATPARD